jgi:hypothetical protein
MAEKILATLVVYPKMSKTNRRIKKYIWGINSQNIIPS